jgi:hypothetical protein
VLQVLACNTQRTRALHAADGGHLSRVYNSASSCLSNTLTVNAIYTTLLYYFYCDMFRFYSTIDQDNLGPRCTVLGHRFCIQHINPRRFSIEDSAHNSARTLVLSELSNPKGSPNTNS